MEFLGIVVILGTSLLAALLLTPLVRKLAIRFKVVAHPTSDRWHGRPTALLGGVAIAIATVVGLAAATFLLGDGWAVRIERAISQPALGVALSAALMLLVGLVDDVVRLRAQSKFLCQLLAGVTLVGFGALLPLTPWHAANVLITLFWFVALTNAFNLLDGLDGVAAGVGAIAALFLGLTFANRGAWPHAALAWSLSGALLGFLRYNFHRASIFMGDAGSLFIGAVLAGLVVSLPGSATASLASTLFVPLAIVAVPLVDTTLVTVTRLLAGRPISHGGLDHSTYRLIALGLSESQVAVLLYGFAAIGGVVGIFLTRLDTGLGLLLGTGFLVALSLLAAYLGRMQVAGYPGDPPKAKAGTLLARNLVYKRRFGELLLDVVLITLAYYGAYRLRFDNGPPADYIAAFQSTIGIVIAIKIAAFGVFGVYRGAWKYAGIIDLWRIVAAVVVSGIGILAFAAWRGGPLAESHSIIYIDALLCAALVLCSRLSFRSLEMVRNWFLHKGDRVLIYGAGDQGELGVRRLANQGEPKLHPVCFLDDDVRMHGAQIHGVPIVGGLENLAFAADRYQIQKIAIGSATLSAEAVAAMHAFAASASLEVVEIGVAVPRTPARPAADTHVRSA